MKTSGGGGGGGAVEGMDSERRRLEAMFQHLGLRKPPAVDAADETDAGG